MIKYFKSINPGIKRLIIIGTFIGASLIGALFELGSSSHFDNFDFVIETIYIGIPVYWAIVFSGLWIYQGFEQNKKEGGEK